MIAVFRELDRRQPALARFGWAMLALALACLLAMAFDDRRFNGLSVWIKPAKFAASFAIWMPTLAWAWGLLTPVARQGAAARIVLWGTLVAATYEQAWITWRAALGAPSHFADDPLGALMYSLMGLGAVILVALAATLGVLVLRRGDPAQPAGWRRAVGLGLILGGVFGGLTGVAISLTGTPHIGGSVTDAANLAPLFWSRDGGDLRAAHFFAIHAMQAVPAFWLLTRAGPSRLALASLGWVGLVAGAFVLARAGIPLSP